MIDLSLEVKNEQAAVDAAPSRRFNWPLITGIIFVTIITILAIVGPNIAPKDPAEEKNITMIDGEWYIPPFDIGTPGYPLGSDSFGRDLYSRLLWGIRPTMIMVFVVAVIRLGLGVIIGLSAGWFTGKTERFLNSLIQLALALPVLLVALGAIAIIGVEYGIWAFIIGLSLTGWVDTALQVREQTRIVKGQVYVEAASAMGATNQQILSNHILKQITPMLLMLFAFEISSTLMLTAGLGFLGYYIGGDVWVETDDFVARRISGSPELGQMLATSWVTLTKPWALVAVGTTIFITVLGFNLIGEGLRQNIGFAKVKRRGLFAEQRSKIGLWIDQNIWHPAIQFSRIRPLRFGLILIAAFFFLSAGALMMLDQASQADVSSVLAGFEITSESIQQAVNPTDNEELLVDESTDVSPQQIITFDPVIVWEFVDESGFSGGPTLSANGDNLITASEVGIVYALNLDGSIIWQNQLPSSAIGTPAIDENGNILIAGGDGELYKLSPEGDLIWTFQTEIGDRSLAGPTIGVDGTIYYTAGTAAEGYVQAVSSEGEGLWATKANTPFFYQSPIPSRDGNYVFLKNDLFSTENGDLITPNYELDVLRYFSGEDGKNYLLAGHKIIQWEQAGNSIETVDIAEWDSSNFSESVAPAFVGVTEDGVSWQLYSTPGGNSRMVWVTLDDQFVGSSVIRISNSNLIEMQSDLTALVCGGGPFNSSSTDCASINPSTNEPLWKFHLGNYGPVTGGVWVAQRYFVATEDGYVFELNENYKEIIPEEAASSQTQVPEISTDLGVRWTYQATDRIYPGIQIGPDAQVYLTSEDGKMHILDSEGNIINVFELPASLYHHATQTGRSAPLDILPAILPDGTIIMISDDQRVIGVDQSGKTLWEETLVAEPAEYPIVDDHGNFYLLDLDAGLNAYTKDGLQWRFQSEAANLPAHGFTLGPEGNIYFVVTDYSRGYIQAVSPGGKELWSTTVTTIDFYDDLHISHDGKFISLAENLIDTTNGEIIGYQSGDKIDEFIFSANGQNYLRSQHTVNRWQPSPSGIEILSGGMVSEEDTSLRPPIGSTADSNGIVWLFYRENYSSGGTFIVWMSPDGELLNRHLVSRDSHSFDAYDMENSTLTDCMYFDASQTLECEAYTPYSAEPFWIQSISDIPAYDYGFIEGKYLYLFSREDNKVTAVYLGDPSLQLPE